MCGKKLVFLLLLSLVFSFSVVAEMTASEKSLMRELAQTNEKLENRLIERDQQLIDKDKQLTELLSLLEVIKTENKTLKQENETTKNLLLNRESFENELRIYLAGEAMAKEVHRWAATGIAILSIGLNGYQFFSNL